MTITQQAETSNLFNRKKKHEGTYTPKLHKHVDHTYPPPTHTHPHEQKSHPLPPTRISTILHTCATPVRWRWLTVLGTPCFSDYYRPADWLSQHAEEEKNGRFYSVVIRESRKEEEKTKQNTRISVQKNRRKTASFHVKPQWLFYYTQGHSETASFTSNHNTVETKERKSYECLNMRNSCFLDYYCLTALPKMLLAKRQTKRKAQSKNDPNAIHILYDECLSCQS